jgi:phosphate transport system permease protein
MPVTAKQNSVGIIAARANARLPLRLRRERWLRRGAGLGAAVVLLAITAIPLYLLWQLWPLSVRAGSETLWPLLFGSLKATVYAMLFGVPLGLGAAIYCAQFSSIRLRAWIRSSLEILNAVPTVLLGLIAVLWLAPRLYAGLSALVACLLLLPGVMLLGMCVWQGLIPSRWARVVAGWQPLLMLPLLMLVGVLVFSFADSSEPLMRLLFDPASPWNGLLIGMTLGLAMVPTVFALAEDALLGVPRSLAHGAYALGANRWQALTTLILPAASSGLLAAVLLGIGRALGESMIVLMASGNTPLLSWHALDGLRAVTANIAIEAPQAAPHSAEFRLLLLSALILFAATFVLHSFAAMLRHRPRPGSAVA